MNRLGLPLTCEHRLNGERAFVLDETGLVVALDADGHPVCVDSVESAAQELRSTGLFDQAAILLEEARAFDLMIRDPNPQPSSPSAGSAHRSDFESLRAM